MNKLATLLLLLLVLTPTVNACYCPGTDPNKPQEETWKPWIRTVTIVKGPMFTWNGQQWIHVTPTVWIENGVMYILYPPQELT